MATPHDISIPVDILKSSEEFDALLSAQSVSIRVPDDYERLLAQFNAAPEVIAIQRLITLARLGIRLSVIWEERIAGRVFSAPALFPLLAVLLTIDCSAHSIAKPDGTVRNVDVQSSRKAIYNFRPITDLFSDSQVMLCSDSRGYGHPKTLYDQDGNLRSRSDFDAFVERLLAAQIGINVSTVQAVKFSQNVSTIVAELFENTDIHAKQDLRGVPFKTNGLRGMIFKRIELPPARRTKYPSPSDLTQSASFGEQQRQPRVALEISVFDSGIGYYGSYMREKLTAEIPLIEEWHVVHRCLERHYEPADRSQTLMAPDMRSSHTGMGLYEVLRALQFLKGKFEVRSGRIYGFRTFFEGETQFQNESTASTTRPGMPKPVLLDQGLQYVSVPTPNEMLVGSIIRVLIPLS
ncbi:MAG: hypothetical protein V4495_19860 [Pseudomonadota bacterium]